MNYNEYAQQQRRLAILTILSAAQAYISPETLIRQGLASAGHQISGDQLRADLAWLNQIGAIYIDDKSHVYVATLTATGNDARQGLADIPGIAKPEPQ